MSIRIGGLASGMDIDSIVKDLMKVERIPLDKLFQKKQTLEWQRDGFRDMNKLLKDLDDLLSVTNTNGIGRQSTFIKKTVTSTNESAVSVRNISSTYDLNKTVEVTQIAKNASFWSKDDFRANTTFDPTTALSTQFANLKNAIPTTDFDIKIEAIQADGTLAAKTISIDPATMSLNQVIDKINKELDVNAFYDDKAGKLVLTAKNSGDAGINKSEIIIHGDTTNPDNPIQKGLQFMQALGFVENNDLASQTQDANSKMIGQVGLNAKFSIDGYAMERTTNTFQINGYEYTIKATTTAPVSISSTTDTEAIFEAITDFVNKYNETIATINEKLSEERYRKYPPLTDEQKEAMSDKEIELWEERAKSGLLRNDPLLSSGLNQMRQDLYSKVSGIAGGFAQLIDIGIKPSSNYRDKGKLIIDEGKLRDAISKDPNEVYKLFNNDGYIEDVNNPGTKVYSEDHLGLAKKLRNSIKETITNIESKAGNTLKVYSQYTMGRELNNIDSQIDRFESRLIDVENRYWKQFTAMEKAIARANEQAGYLMNQFGGGMN